MKPPNITPPPTDQLSQQPPAPSPTTAITTTTTATANTNTTTTPPPPIHPTQNNTSSGQTNSTPTLIASQPSIIAKAPTVTTAQIQQAPLALTTQPQNKQPQVQTTKSQLQGTSQQVVPTTIQSSVNPQLQSKIQPTQMQTTTIATQSAQPITLAATPTATGPTALVIIPQHSTTTSITSAKTANITSKTTSIPTTLTTATATHVALATTTQSSTIQMQTPVTTIVPAITSIPITAHQQSTTLAQTALVNRPPQTLPVMPITTTPASIKQEPNKYICCLLDNGIRCDRIAGNASFSARIQKIVGTKKMNFALDPTVRHAYICDHHKAIITVAKKSTALVRDTKSNARNYTANNNANTLNAAQHGNSFNELTINQATLQHPMNLDMLTNQNRLASNHAGVLNSIPVRPGTQLAYGHYQGPHSDQVGPINAMMPGSFDNTGGDSIPSSSASVDVDLQQLQVNTLRRYKRHFRVQTRPGLNKMQLAESLKSHFRTLPIIEKEAITYFVYIVKCYRNKLDHNPKAD